MKKIKVFVDSDVAISSLKSTTGAAHFLLNKADINLYYSNISGRELKQVAKRLNIPKGELVKLINNRFRKVNLRDEISKIKENFASYTLDVDDTHIVAGAKKAKTRFLITYNIKHFKIEKIHQDFNIIVTTPARLLQYLRGLD